ncbi:MAG: integration host factor subunit alpha [Beijerinckiaceae bacterium]
MAHKTLTRQDLLQVASTAGPPGLTRNDARDIVEATLEAMSAALARGESVKLRGFGTFNVRAKNPRVGRNPKTGKEYPITARRVLTFKASPRLVAAVNGETFTGSDDDDDDGPAGNGRLAAARVRGPVDRIVGRMR